MKQSKIVDGAVKVLGGLVAVAGLAATFFGGTILANKKSDEPDSEPTVEIIDGTNDTLTEDSPTDSEAE